MMNDGLSAGDILALTKDNNDGMGTMWNNPFIYLVWLALLGNGGLFGNRGATEDGVATRNAIYESNNNQDMFRTLGDLSGQIGLNRVETASKLNDITAALNENRFAQESCCCSTKGLIKDLAAENYKNTCEITSAIHAEGEMTRGLIEQNTIQALRDKLADKDRESLAYQFKLSQQEQNAQLVQALRPFPQPAYVTCSPYTSGNSCNCTAF